jgi:hypothetical protein
VVVVAVVVVAAVVVVVVAVLLLWLLLSLKCIAPPAVGQVLALLKGGTAPVWAAMVKCLGVKDTTECGCVFLFALLVVVVVCCSYR